MINPEEVTIIIPHLGRTSESKFALRECLLSLEETAPQIKKILVINGLKFEEDYTLFDGEGFETTNLSIMTLEDQGQCKAVNAAVATNNTPWIFVTNDDMVYAPGWFEKLMDGMQEGRFCISPKLVEPRKGAPTFLVEFCGGAGGDFDKQKFLDYVKNYDGVSALGTFCHPGFNLPFLISKELWDTVGGYDISYDPWGSNSDSDLEYKIKLAGVQPIQNDKCLVYHFSQTSGTFNPENNEYYQRNFQIFRDKWGFDRTDDGIWEATFSIPDEGRKFRPEWEGKYNVGI